MQKNSGTNTRATRIGSENFCFSDLFLEFWNGGKVGKNALLSRDLAGYKDPGHF